MIAQITGRVFFFVGLLIFFLLFTFQTVRALAEDFHVVQVAKSLKMSESDRVFKDYYINAGKEQGLKEGMLVPVKRRLTIEDSFRKIVDDKVMIDVAQLQLLTVHDKVSVGRLVTVTSPKQRGVLEFPAVMTGDKVDIRKAKMGKSSNLWDSDVSTGSATSASKAPATREEKVKPSKVSKKEKVSPKSSPKLKTKASAQESMLDAIPILTQ